MLEARRRRSHHAFYRRFGGLDLPGGVRAAITPRVPERSLFNAVVYDDAGAVLAAYDELAAAYRDAGVRAWTVWVLPEDRALARALGERGHVLDAAPEAMGAELDAIDLAGDDLAVPGDWADMVAINEAAYGAPPGTVPFPRLDDVRLLAVPGRAVVGVLDCDGDAWIGMVATHPSAQRQGLCRQLLRQALREARARGCTTTSLEATRAGRPVYERLGYAPLGTLEMWEHRTVPSS